MEVHKEIQEPKTLTREQKRLVEKVQAEAQETFQKLADKFLKAFTEVGNPESEEFKETITILDSQWRTYCKRRKLDPKAETGLRMYIDDTFKDYQESKNQAK